ncbi:hypothetical protein X947_5849 [Burkholderia pseudomallei MSHR7334]|nr:hypothetical protein X947_5849 [Burkholderia pseudomallei MSHR7334]
MSAFALTGLKVVNFGLDLSGSMPAARLTSKGAAVQHIEPPAGDPEPCLSIAMDGRCSSRPSMKVHSVSASTSRKRPIVRSRLPCARMQTLSSTRLCRGP